MSSTIPNGTAKERILLGLIMQQSSSMEVAHGLKLLIICWRPVLSLPQLLIATAVFKNTFVDRRSHGCQVGLRVAGTKCRVIIILLVCVKSDMLLSRLASYRFNSIVVQSKRYSIGMGIGIRLIRNRRPCSLRRHLPDDRFIENGCGRSRRSGWNHYINPSPTTGPEPTRLPAFSPGLL